MELAESATRGPDRGAEASSPAPPTLREPFLTVDSFLPPAEAQGLRSAFEAHFAAPHAHRAETHQVWNYWHVPDLYTYLRTTPEKVIPRPLVAAFHERLARWARDRLGLGHVTWPNLSLYVDGCVQHLHNDSTNGRFGFVYSITPDHRRGGGGETIVLREGDLFRTHLTRAGAGPSLNELIAPRFNRLTVFDDRMPHGVRRVEGGMDPLDGRVVLHGHISESKPWISGALVARELWEAAWEAVDDVLADDGAAGECHGPLTVRMTVGADGAVEAVRPLVDRVVRAGGGDARPLVDRMIAGIGRLSFPAAEGASEATLPIMIGGPLPWMDKHSAVPRRVRPANAAPVPEPEHEHEPGPATAAAPVRPADEDLEARSTGLAAVRRRLAAASGAARIPNERLEAYVVRDFVAADACARLAALVGPEPEGPLADPAAAEALSFAHKVDALLGIGSGCAEPVQGLRAGEGGREAAVDFFDPDDPAWHDERLRGGQRTWTAALFLDRPAGGGQMVFPNVGLKLTPAPGYLLVWCNLAADGEPNGFAVYETLPVEGGEHRLLMRRYRERATAG